MCDHICINVYMWIISADSWLSSLQLKMYGELKKQDPRSHTSSRFFNDKPSTFSVTTFFKCLRIVKQKGDVIIVNMQLFQFYTLCVLAIQKWVNIGKNYTPFSCIKCIFNSHQGVNIIRYFFVVCFSQSPSLIVYWVCMSYSRKIDQLLSWFNNPNNYFSFHLGKKAPPRTGRSTEGKPRIEGQV